MWKRQPPLLLYSFSWMPDVQTWPLFSSPPITAEFPSPLSLGGLSCEVVSQTLFSPHVSCPLSSPDCQASSDIPVPQTLLSLAFLLGLLWSLWAVPTWASAPPCRSVVGRSIFAITLCSSHEMNFNTKTPSAAEFLPHQRREWRPGTVLFLAPLPRPAIVSPHRH